MLMPGEIGDIEVEKRTQDSSPRIIGGGSGGDSLTGSILIVSPSSEIEPLLEWPTKPRPDIKQGQHSTRKYSPGSIR